MNIRSATLKDARNISKLIGEAALPHKEQDFEEAGWLRFVESNSEAGVSAKLREDRRVTLIAEDQGRLLGLISITGGEKIDLLFVCLNHRREGIASRLWQAVRNQCEAGPHSTAFWVRSSSAAVPFYEQLGFTTENGRQWASGISFFLMKQKVNKQLNGDAAGGAR